MYCPPWEEQQWVALCLGFVSSEANSFVSDIYLFLPDLPSKQSLGLSKLQGFLTYGQKYTNWQAVLYGIPLLGIVSIVLNKTIKY